MPEKCLLPGLLTDPYHGKLFEQSCDASKLTGLLVVNHYSQHDNVIAKILQLIRYILETVSLEFTSTSRSVLASCLFQVTIRTRHYLRLTVPFRVLFDFLEQSEQFIQKVEFNRQKYETPLPWKTDHELLPDNFLLYTRNVWFLHTSVTNVDISQPTPNLNTGR